MKKKTRKPAAKKQAVSRGTKKKKVELPLKPVDEDLSRLKSPGPKIKLPDWAIIKKPEKPEDPFPDSPVISTSSKLKAEVDLIAIAHDLLSGKRTLSDVTQPGISTTAHGLHACSHWLPDNRLDWWQTFFTEIGRTTDNLLSTGPLRRDDQFECEFSPAVGAIIDWEALSDGDDPNSLPGIEFTVMTTDPRCRPVVREMMLEIDDHGVPQPAAPHRAIVNCWEDEPPEDPDERRPSLFVVFNRPQRAVGLSYGFVPAANRTGGISTEGIELIGYNINGQEITRADGRLLSSNRPSPRWIESGMAYSRIGLRSSGGDIMYVELRFGFDRQHRDDGPGELVREPQLVYRVWHEPYPSAAVTQGEIEAAGKGFLLQNTVTKQLPFGCDRALVFLRGFKAEFPDEPHPIDKLSIEVSIASLSNSSATVGLRGAFHGEENPNYLVRAYYSLVAWDSNEIEIFSAPIHGGVHNSSATGTVMETGDPCPSVAILRSRDVDEESCQLLAGGITGFMFHYPEPAEPDELFFQPGTPVRSGQLPGGTPRVAWPAEFNAESDGDDNITWRLTGYVLAGPSLTDANNLTLNRSALRAAGTEPTEDVILLDEGGREISFGTGPRPPKGHGWHFFKTKTINGVERDLALTIEADMAFASLGHVLMEIGDEPQQLECEVLGVRYDGRTFQFKRGAGISTEDPGDYDQHHQISFMPKVIGLRRKRQAARARLFTRELRFDGVVEGTFVTEATQTGAIQNRGTQPVLITGGRRGGPHETDFYVLLAKVARQIRYDSWMFERLERQWQVFTIFDLPDRSPIRLEPGETLIVSANTYIQGSGERHAYVEFMTNDTLMPIVQIDIIATTRESDAVAYLFPETYNFGQVQVGQLRDRNALVLSTGSTPLLITDLSIADPTQGFSFQVFGTYNPPNTYQVNPGESWPDQHIRIRFEPPGVGEFSTTLDVVTNAGVKKLQLVGAGI